MKTFTIMLEINCCTTPGLDNINQNFEVCQLDEFQNERLGECNNFEIEDFSKVNVTLKFTGTDGWLGSYIR